MIGLTTSQTAANVLTEAGVTRAHNTARFLGHLEAPPRSPRPAARSRPGSLLILDEASMMSTRRPRRDPGHRPPNQLQGHRDRRPRAARRGRRRRRDDAARPPPRLRPARRARSGSPHPWERDATLRLRAGDITVLADYDEHGRLRGGDPEEAVEQAYRGWLADYLAGQDSVLIARTDEQARELSRRARDDLIRYGLVAARPATSASPQASRPASAT